MKIGLIKIFDFLPRSQVQDLQFSLHISYFLQKCKKRTSPDKGFVPLKNDITAFL